MFGDPVIADKSEIRLRTALSWPHNSLHNRAERSNGKDNPHEVHRQQPVDLYV